MLFPPVRLSRCLIRTANGASSARGGMPSHLHQQQPFSLPCGSRNEQGTPFHAASSRDPKNLGQVCRSLRGGLGLRTSACPAWFLDPWPASREHFQAG